MLALGFLPYGLLIALPICVIASILALSAGLGSRALTARLVRSGRAGGALTGGLGVVATGVAVALVMAGPLGGFGPAFPSAEASQPESLFDLDEVAVEVGCGLRLDEASARVEGRVPGHVSVGPQSYQLVPATTGLIHRGVEQCTAVAALAHPREDRKLLQVSYPGSLNNVDEPDDGGCLGFLGD